MIKFSILGTTVIFDFSFFAVLALLCLVNDPVFISTAICACMFHELGHLIMAVYYKIKIKKVMFWAGGIRMISAASMLSYRKDTIVLLAGPAANIFVFIIMLAMGHQITAYINLCLGLFNLLPFSNLDGGAALKSTFQISDAYIHIFAACFSVITLILMIIFDVWNISFFITLILMLIFEFFFKC